MISRLTDCLQDLRSGDWFYLAFLKRIRRRCLLDRGYVPQQSFLLGVLQSGLAGLVPLNLAARFLVLFEFFDASFNDLGEAYGAAFLLRGLV